MPTTNRTTTLCCLSILSLFCSGLCLSAAEAKKQYPLAGADESTPSVAHYFSWIDNTNEGSTEAQTLANLDFFKWIHDEYGMHLEIYAFDAGNIDAPRYYGSIDSDRFKEHFPLGLDPIYEKAKSFGCRLGVWLGPDGFGDTPDQQKARTDMLVKLCRDYDFRLFKVDAVCGQLRTEKQNAFIEMLKKCREYCPDLIVINHRLNLGHGLPYVTTKLWGGEAYIDVWRSNRQAATHNRACTVELGIPVDENGRPVRLVEDHGVCFSSCLDGWEDDLFLQAFSRNLILSPQMYGSPWFLRDDEFPKVARVYNLARTYREILVNGQILPPEIYGLNAVSRGDGDTRMVVLRNPGWEPATHAVKLDESIGLTCDGPVEVRRLHPSEEILGTFGKGDSVEVTIPAFRGYVLLISSKPSQELGVEGCEYEVVRDVPGKPAVIKLLGMPGTTARVRLPAQPREFAKATLDGKSADGLLAGGIVEVSFAGQKLSKPWHRKLADLDKCDVPADAESLYEATCYAADNNALEIRSKFRSGPTKIKQVQQARDAFFGQKLLVERGVWDRYLFDGNLETYFRLRTKPIWDGALRVDFGEPTRFDRIVLRRANWATDSEEAFVSADLKSWLKVPVKITQENPATATVLERSYTVDKTWLDISVKKLDIEIPADAPAIRYLRIPGSAANVAEVVAYRDGKQLERDRWRASNVFAQYSRAPAKVAWQGSFTVDEAAPGSYLVVACIGRHGRDGAYAALRVGDRLVGAPSRAVSYPANHWEHGNRRADAGCSYFFPVTPDMIGKPIEAVVLQFDSSDTRRPVPLGEITPQTWITNLPAPYASKELVLEEIAEQVSGAVRVQHLRCEYRDQPLGIDHPAPRLSWTLDSSVRGQKQTAYRVLVARTPEILKADRGDLWDSGKTASSQSVNIRYAGAALASGQRCFWKVKVWDKDDESSNWSDPSSWEMGLLKASDWIGSWINDGQPLPEQDADCYRDDPAPLFRKEFKLSGPVRSARLYIAALGYVHARLNGRAVGDQHLDPLWTLPNKRVFYSVHDVTEHLEPDDNCLGVTLGNGWYNPLPLRMWGRVNLRERLPVGRPQFIAQLVIEYADGSRDLLGSDASWKVAPGPILRNSIYLGEKVDARKTLPGWDKPGLDDSNWKSATAAPAPAGILQSQHVPPIEVTASVKPVRVTEPSDGVYIVDMGQNFGGWARFTFDIPAGTEITMRYGELLYEDGTLNPMTSVCGQIKRKTAPADGSPAVAWQTDTYIARGGGPETYTPRFTFHAFRYVEITGLPARPSLDDIEGLRMNCAVEPVGSFACSNDRFNQIQKMCQWTFLSNLFGVQSDCPHRERFGYGGDLVTTSDAFLLNYDMANFYTKSARDWHDSALPDGMLTDTAPSVGIQYCGVGWAMTHPHLQLQLYRYYADRRIIEEQYATSRRWLELVGTENPTCIIARGLHDHEALEKEKSPPMVTPLYCESARMLSRLARILGKEDEAVGYDRLAEDIRKAYVEKFFVPETGVVASGIQGAQAFALYLNMLPPEQRSTALAHLLKDITEKHNGHLTTGIFGTRYMLDVLSREGRADVVHDMVNRPDFPGWGHMLEQGATTLWEHWQFSDNTYSHNHPMFGSVSGWFYNWLGGIEPEVDAVGFDKFTFQPQFLEGLDWVRCTYRSVRGPITCDWKRQDQRVALDLHVPVNTSATLILPAAGTLTENDRPAVDSMGVERLGEADGHAAFRLKSGQYHLVFAASRLEQ